MLFTKTITLVKESLGHLVLRLYPSLVQKVSSETSDKIKEHLFQFIKRNEEKIISSVTKSLESDKEKLSIEEYQKLFQDTLALVVLREVKKQLAILLETWKKEGSITQEGIDIGERILILIHCLISK